MTYDSVFRPELFAGRSVLITGGGSGIGRCIAHELASLGAHVVITGRTEQKLVVVVAEIVEDGGAASHIVADNRDHEQVSAAVATAIEVAGPIHGLVNNAGGQFPAMMADLSTKGFEAVVRNNLTGTFTMMREVFTQSMRDTGGSIVNITADHHTGFPMMSHTGAARAGVANLTMTAAREWAPHGVRINEVAPGTIASSGMNTYDRDFQEQVIKAFEAHTPMRRMGREAEVSSVVTFLLSDASAYMTGGCIRVDGGTDAHRSWPLADTVNGTVFDGFHRSELPEFLRE